MSQLTRTRSPTGKSAVALTELPAFHRLQRFFLWTSCRAPVDPSVKLLARTFCRIPGCGDKISCHPSCALIVLRVVSKIRVEFVSGERPHFRARDEVAATADPTKARRVQRVLMVGVEAPRTIFFLMHR